MHFTGFQKNFQLFAGDVSLASFINFTSTPTDYTPPLVQHYHHIQFYLILLLAFFTACPLSLNSWSLMVLKFLDS